MHTAWLGLTSLPDCNCNLDSFNGLGTCDLEFCCRPVAYVSRLPVVIFDLKA